MPSSKRILLAACAAAAIAAAPNAAFAQKSTGVLRVTINEPFTGVDPYNYPATEAAFFYDDVYDMLINLDENKKEFVPSLAKSWTRIDEKTIDFELYDDIAFHSGNKFTADDVVYTLKYAADPKVNIRFKTRYTIFDDIEKLGTHKVRLKFSSLYADDLLHAAMRTNIFDSKLHASYEDKADYGRKSPVGTGPYKVTQFDRVQGVTLERVDGGRKHYFTRAPIKTVKGVFVPDEQTRIAQLLVGDVDMLYNVSPDNASQLGANPKLGITPIESLTLLHFKIDAMGRSKYKQLTDPRVRKAIFMSVNREELIKSVVPGGDIALRLNAMCFDSMLACDYTTKPPAYDPDGAKKLLAEAGYPDGFDIVLDSHIVTKKIAEAVSGYLRKVGIRATVNPVLQANITKRRASGEVGMIVSYAPQRSFPEASNILDMRFGVESVRYIDDPRLFKAMADGLASHDLAKRKAAYRGAFDLLNDISHAMPISSLPTVWAHTRDVRIQPHILGAARGAASNVFWN